ncbi:hypothetical protein GCM10027416_18040 [Okibacterium endophyticum]
MCDVENDPGAGAGRAHVDNGAERATAHRAGSPSHGDINDRKEIMTTPSTSSPAGAYDAAVSVGRAVGAGS